MTQCAQLRPAWSQPLLPPPAPTAPPEESAAGEADDKNWWEEGWQEILAQVQQDSHNLHEFLAYAEVCDETEAYWQDAAAAGDVVALASRRRFGCDSHTMLARTARLAVSEHNSAASGGTTERQISRNTIAAGRSGSLPIGSTSMGGRAATAWI